MNNDKDIYEGHRIDPQALALVRKQIETENRIKTLIKKWMKERSYLISVDNIQVWLNEEGYPVGKWDIKQYVSQIFDEHLGR